MQMHLDRRTLAEDLERRRLQHRATRLDHVLHALRDRALHRSGDGHVPLPLREAIHGFERELDGVRARLAQFHR